MGIHFPPPCIIIIIKLLLNQNSNSLLESVTQDVFVGIGDSVSVELWNYSLTLHSAFNLYKHSTFFSYNLDKHGRFLSLGTGDFFFSMQTFKKAPFYIRFAIYIFTCQVKSLHSVSHSSILYTWLSNPKQLS